MSCTRSCDVDHDCDAMVTRYSCRFYGTGCGIPSDALRDVVGARHTTSKTYVTCVAYSVMHVAGRHRRVMRI